MSESAVRRALLLCVCVQVHTHGGGRGYTAAQPKRHVAIEEDTMPPLLAAAFMTRCLFLSTSIALLLALGHDTKEVVSAMSTAMDLQVNSDGWCCFPIGMNGIIIVIIIGRLDEQWRP